MPLFPCCCPFCPSTLGFCWAQSSLLGEGPGAQRPGLQEKQGSWSLPGVLVPLLERKRVGKGAACQNSELHYIPSWGCRGVGCRGDPSLSILMASGIRFPGYPQRSSSQQGLLSGGKAAGKALGRLQ